MKEVMSAKKSSFSEECIRNKGLCCETRTPMMLLPGELDKLVKSGFPKNVFVDKGKFAIMEGRCPYFKAPLCRAYSIRPVDCRAYPVTIALKNGKTGFFIDMNCPAVKKGLIDDEFIDGAIKLWKDSKPPRKWLEESAVHNMQGNAHCFVPISEYRKYRSSLAACK